MFPKQLDGANVLYFTEKNNFGVVANPDGSNPQQICYLAICKYEKDDGYYLFLCNENLEVVTDDLLYSIKECFECAASRKENIKWYSFA